MKPIFGHVTAPVDGSTTSQRGILFALEFARDGGRVSFCSVVDPMLVCVPLVHDPGFGSAPALEMLDADAAMFCRDAEAQAAAHGSSCDSCVLHGSCIEEISAYSARNGCAAIVIGTHGRTGLLRAVLGSVAEGIVRRADIPVVCVHEDDALRSGPLAVAIDSSRAAQAALGTAVAIAAARGMPARIIHVRCASTDGASIDALLARAIERFHERGIATHVAMREGDAAAELLAAADEEDCCMMVMGTHGRSAGARWALGSVAAAVVERAKFPVVTVRCA